MVLYLMNKIMLAQFLEVQNKALTAFADSLLPHMLATETRFEENKAAFVEHLEKIKKESLQAVHDQYGKTVNGTLEQIRQFIKANLETVGRSMQSEQGSMSRMLDEQRGKFRETVEDFKKTMWYAAYTVGGAFLLSAVGVAVWVTQR